MSSLSFSSSTLSNSTSSASRTSSSSSGLLSSNASTSTTSLASSSSALSELSSVLSSVTTLLTLPLPPSTPSLSPSPSLVLPPTSTSTPSTSTSTPSPMSISTPMFPSAPMATSPGSSPIPTTTFPTNTFPVTASIPNSGTISGIGSTNTGSTEFPGTAVLPDTSTSPDTLASSPMIPTTAAISSVPSPPPATSPIPPSPTPSPAVPMSTLASTVIITTTGPEGSPMTTTPPIVTVSVTFTSNHSVYTTNSTAVNPTLSATNPGQSFWQDTAAVIGVFVLVALTVILLVVGAILFFRRRRQLRIDRTNWGIGQSVLDINNPVDLDTSESTHPSREIIALPLDGQQQGSSQSHSSSFPVPDGTSRRYPGEDQARFDTYAQPVHLPIVPPIIPPDVFRRYDPNVRHTRGTSVEPLLSRQSRSSYSESAPPSPGLLSGFNGPISSTAQRPMSFASINGNGTSNAYRISGHYPTGSQNVGDAGPESQPLPTDIGILSKGNAHKFSSPLAHPLPVADLYAANVSAPPLDREEEEDSPSASSTFLNDGADGKEVEREQEGVISRNRFREVNASTATDEHYFPRVLSVRNPGGTSLASLVP